VVLLRTDDYKFQSLRLIAHIIPWGILIHLLVHVLRMLHMMTLRWYIMMRGVLARWVMMVPLIGSHLGLGISLTRMTIAESHRSLLKIFVIPWSTSPLGPLMRMKLWIGSVLVATSYLIKHSSLILYYLRMIHLFLIVMVWINILLKGKDMMLLTRDPNNMNNYYIMAILWLLVDILLMHFRRVVLLSFIMITLVSLRASGRWKRHFDL